MTHSLRATFVTACLALATVPAAAQSYDSSVGTGNTVPVYATTGQPRMIGGARSAYAQDSGALRATSRGGRVLLQGPAARAFNAVEDATGVAGSDPDPNIRFQLHRESLQGRW